MARVGTRTVNISLPERLVDALDRQAQAEARSRNDVIRTAALSYLQWWKEWRRLQAYGRRRARRLGVRSQDLYRLTMQVRTERSVRR